MTQVLKLSALFIGAAQVGGFIGYLIALAFGITGSFETVAMIIGAVGACEACGRTL